MGNNETLNDLEVWILTYNRDEYLEYAINSILNQTLNPKVISVYDNGSQDRTESIVKS